MRPLRAIPRLVALLSALVAGAALADPVAEDAAKVAKLRVEVEALAADLAAERRAAAEARAVWTADRRALELAVTKAKARVAAQRAAAPKDTAHEAPRAPEYGALPDIVAALHERVKGGLPFRLEPRRAAVAALAEDLAAGRAAPGRAAVTLARFLRDERRLAETVGRAREVLNVEGARRMTDVLRLGLVTLLVELPDGRAGCTVPSKGYAVRLFPPGPEHEAVHAAFESYHVHPGGGRTQVPALCLGGAE